MLLLSFHHEDINFLTNHVSHSNLKLQSLLYDLQDDSLLSIVASIALFFKYFTSPYWQLVNSNVTYGQFPPYVVKMRQFLRLWNTLPVRPSENLNSLLGDNFSFDDEKVFLKFMSSDKCNKTLLTAGFKESLCQSEIVLNRQLIF